MLGPRQGAASRAAAAGRFGGRLVPPYGGMSGDRYYATDLERRRRLVKNELRRKHADLLSRLVSLESAQELIFEPGERGALARGCCDGIVSATRNSISFFQLEYDVGYTRGVELRLRKDGAF